MAINNERLKPDPVIIGRRVLAMDPSNRYSEVYLDGEFPEKGRIFQLAPGKTITLQREIAPRDVDDGYPPYCQVTGDLIDFSLI